MRTEFHQRAGIRISAIPDRVWVDADRLAREALVHSDKGKVISVPTKRWKVFRFLGELAPRGAIRSTSRILTKSRD